MATWIEQMEEVAEAALTTPWNVRDGTVIPDTSTVALSDGAVRVDATFLYADLAGSSVLAKHCPWETTAKIIRAYLECATRLIRAYNGEIKSFDGDRVMGVFMGGLKNTYATSCAREIDWVVENILNKKATEKFKSIRDNSISIRHCVGIDTGKAVAVRAGIRSSNDLIWIGRAPSLAAKLSDIRNYPYAVYISDGVFKMLSVNSKKVGSQEIWEARTFKFAGADQAIYRTMYIKEP